MKEDIKILENLKEKTYRTDDILGNLVLNEDEYTAIENLIQRNKELEEEIEKDKIKIDFLAGKKLIEVEEHAKQVKIEFDKIYILKSKIKEKIEKLKILAEKSKNDNELDIRKNQIYVLQHLLED